MSLAIVYTRACAGVAAPQVIVEIHLAKGLPNFCIVGLPAAAVKESRDRVRSAIINSGFEFPRGRLTVNLAPADLPKDGGRFDLPIALGILAAMKQIPEKLLSTHEFSGELALSGELRPVRGVLPMTLGIKQSNRILIVPRANAEEAALVQDALSYSATHLTEVCAYLKSETSLPRCETILEVAVDENVLDIADVRGHAFAKRALEIAAAGKHSLLFIGPPGTGKTMLASRLPTLVPALSEAEALEVAAIASISTAGFDNKNWCKVPYRAPHHTTSSVALVGGGRPPRPGEISLSHRGILFLDELPEFNRHVLEALREPLESGSVTISRAAYQAIFPAKFQLIAAMNPCPCGFATHVSVECRCTEEQVSRYRGKLSGPLLDRIDMQVEVPSLSPEMLLAQNAAEEKTSAQIKKVIAIAYSKQFQRQRKFNAELSAKELEQAVHLEEEALQLLNQIMQHFQFSARVCHRLIRVARTIADLADLKQVSAAHISEALSFRSLDRVKFQY